MNYSMNVRYKKNRKQAVFKRILISWVIILLVGAMIGFFIGRSTKQAIALPVTSETNETSISSTPFVTSTPIQETSEPTPKTELVSLGVFRITAYCHCEKCCGNWAKNRPTDEDGSLLVYTASGELAVEGVTIAADTSILPFGTEVIIDGNRYIVQDRGKVIKNNRIDVYFENHQDALEFGVQYKEVFIERMIEND
ncbi:MAG TPA: 3D domain-containing protein [Thermodesulfovibrio thiophilus]|mgnify:CR=1 FL=1|nr:3D domain-containing protein [Thermodesulfovibrio thiophilus]HQD36987.1 3D domain-containing protein [Thermodesulfovibrio thiophilus]